MIKDKEQNTSETENWEKWGQKGLRNQANHVLQLFTGNQYLSKGLQRSSPECLPTERKELGEV